MVGVRTDTGFNRCLLLNLLEVLRFIHTHRRLLLLCGCKVCHTGHRQCEHDHHTITNPHGRLGHHLSYCFFCFFFAFRCIRLSFSFLTLGSQGGQRLILIGELFFQKFQSLEIIGDMYRYTEAFCHYS